MNSNASSHKAYGPTELDQVIQDEFFDSLDSDKEVGMIMPMSMQEENGPASGAYSQLQGLNQREKSGQSG